MAYIEELFSDHFIRYASYVIRDRAIPSLDDGLKPVQRRILQSLWDMDDGKFHKVANVVGHCMQYHPHGDASIYGALVNLSNKELFIEKQGNFGNIYTGDPASAARYIECRLSKLAHRTLFDPEVTQFLPSYDGRRNEPIAFPAKLPFLLILGAEGIAVGMSTRILPHNFVEVIDAMCAELHGKEFEILPDFLTGGLLDTSQYNRGNGKVLSRARLECGSGRITIRELPYGVTTESLIGSLETAVKKSRIQVQTIQNFTAEEVEIVLELPRGSNAEEQVEALYAFSDCEVSISCNLLTIDEKRPIEMDTNAVVRYSCRHLKKILQAELELEIEKLKQQLFSRNLERIFIEERLYKRIEELTKLREIEESILAGLEPYCQKGGELGGEEGRTVTKDELSALLGIPIRRISLYDIGRVQKELRDLEKRLRQAEKHLKSLTVYALSYLAELREEFGSFYPRKTELGSFAKIDVRQAARRDQNLRYDSKEGFLGYGLKEGVELFACSPYDRVLLLRSSGSYSVFDVPEKLFVGKDVRFCHLADKEELAKLEAAVFYLDEKSGYAYAKRIRFGGYILGKEYSIVPETANLKAKLECFACVSSERSQELLSLKKRLLRVDRGSKEETGLKERLEALEKLPTIVAQPSGNVGAFGLLYQIGKDQEAKRGRSKGKGKAENGGGSKAMEAVRAIRATELWHYRFSDLPEKTVKARGQLLGKRKVSSVKIVSERKLARLLASSSEKAVLALDFPPPVKEPRVIELNSLEPNSEERS
ncbi:DNA topoisomerase IV subunit A [Candidatus Haliotispira prima]|uniref:DNA topoisomerase IV subunit A n=1 Tax=Candidatus Haliotispira prima TaxID=3034016 RepID=A0ABY8MGN7_9SPIO|nr:DNA topoisomerase IV subunit A [Candidatus Haliotispira prima]